MRSEENNMGLPPSGNTGAMDTIENGLRALVDWVSVSFSTVKELKDLIGILGLKEEQFEVRDSGFRGYKNSAIFGHITIAWGSPKNSTNMGGFIEMSGQGCREYESHFDMKLNWSEFFALVMNFPHKFSRLDIAIDDFKKYFTVEQAYRCAKRGCLVAQRVRKARTYEDFFLEDGATHGRTLYIGKSDWQITFYDKMAERQNAQIDYSDVLKFWNRYEIRLRNDIATQAAHVLAYESYSLGEFAKGFMAAKIDFKVNNIKDSNKSRWKSQKWWLKFLGDVEKLKLTQSAPDPSIQRIGNWLNSQVDTSLATFLEAFDDSQLVVDYFKIKGKKKMKKKNDDMIQEFKKNDSLKKRMYDEMYDYVNKNRHIRTTTASDMPKTKSVE